MTPWIVLIVVVAVWWALIGRPERRRAARAKLELEVARDNLERARARLGEALKAVNDR